MTLLIIQARMGSTRLPGKVLKNINGKPLIQHLLDRLKPSQHVDQRIIAIPTNPEDDALEQYCLKRGEQVYRGSDWDVLDRFYQAALTFKNPDTIVRICADNPLHSYKVLDKVLERFIQKGVDYASNSNHEPDVLEDGFDVEVFSFKTLKTAWENAKLLSEREHVTPFIKSSPAFDCHWEKTCPAYKHKLSVDTEEDRKAVEEIFKSLAQQPDFSIEEVNALLEERKDILNINKESIINSGFHKSIKNDKIVK